MGVHATKGRFPINLSQICLVVEILQRLETTTYHLFLVQMKKTYYDDMYCDIHEILNKNINISSVKNWFEFVRALFKPFHFIKR